MTGNGGVAATIKERWPPDAMAHAQSKGCRLAPFAYASDEQKWAMLWESERSSWLNWLAVPCKLPLHPPPPMPRPQRNNKKSLIFRDTHYQWIIHNRVVFNELQVELSASVNGQLLLVELPRIVNHEMVTGAIEFGRQNGWTPEQSVPPFRCKYARKVFERVCA